MLLVARLALAATATAAMAYRRRLLAGATLLRGDACNPLDMLAVFEAARPQRVVHLAAVARAPLNEQHVSEAIHTATASVTTTIQQAARFGVRCVLLVSSSYVYGDFQYTPCDEDHPTSPTTAYGAAKLAAEVITRALAASMRVPCTIVRLIAVYGPWDLNGKLPAPNLAEAVTTGRLPIAGRPRRGALAIDRARALLGYAPRVDLEDGLADCVRCATAARTPALQEAWRP